MFEISHQFRATPKRIRQNKMGFHTEDFMEPRGIELLIQGDTVRYKNLFIFSAL